MTASLDKSTCNCYQVDADLVDVGVFKMGVAKFSMRYGAILKLQPHHTKIPRSDKESAYETSSYE